MDAMTREHVVQSIEAVVKEYAVPAQVSESMETIMGSFKENFNTDILNEENIETCLGKHDPQDDVDGINERGTVGSVTESNLDVHNENIVVQELEKCTTKDSNGNTVDVIQKAIVPKQSGELIGFKCGTLGCGKIVKIQHTEASYSLERLKRHHAQVHTDADENDFTYTNVMKESSNQRVEKSAINSKKVKDAQKQTNISSKLDDDPLKILKEVKAAHEKSKEVAKMQSEKETEICIEKTV